MYRIALVVLLATVTASAAELEDVPARTEIARERPAVRQLYDRSLNKAAAARLLADKAAAVEMSALRYAMLDEAKRLAKEANDPELRLQLVDTMAQYFRINASAEKLDILAKQRVRTMDEQRELLKRVVAMADAADMANDYKTAGDALQVAGPMARRVEDTELVKTLTQRSPVTKMLAREWAAMKDAVEPLQTNPDDPDANVQLGLFYCLIRQEWPRGLMAMAKGVAGFPEPELALTMEMGDTLPEDRDERALALAKVAWADLQHPTDAETCTRLGNSWVAVSKLYKGELSRRLLARAGRWYAKAIAALSGASRLALEQRVAQIAGVNWYGVPGGRIKSHHIYNRLCRSTATRVWARSPSQKNPRPPLEEFPQAYGFKSYRSQTFPGLTVTCGNPDSQSSDPSWSPGGWELNETIQELTIRHSNKSASSTGYTAVITKVFSVGLRGGKLFLYNCCQDGVETNETVLECGSYLGTLPIDLTR